MQFSRDIARQQASLASPRCRVPRHCVYQDTDTRRERCVPALCQYAGNRASQDVAGARGRHTGVTSLTQAWHMARRSHESAGSF
jgi:hypothetical protein